MARKKRGKGRRKEFGTEKGETSPSCRREQEREGKRRGKKKGGRKKKNTTQGRVTCNSHAFVIAEKGEKKGEENEEGEEEVGANFFPLYSFPRNGG